MLRRKLLSFLIAGHMVALLIAAVPDPGDVRLAEGAADKTDDKLSAVVRPGLDVAAAGAAHANDTLWRILAPVRPSVNRYIRFLGLEQSWKMFANPPHGGEYLRFRFYDAEPPSNDRFRVTTELVFPLAINTETHFFRSYRLGHHDKTISNSFGPYFVERLQRSAAGERFISAQDPGLRARLARGFVPVERFFSERHQRQLPANRRLVRTEAWYGWAPSRARGDIAVGTRSRAAVLNHYYEGPSSEETSQPIDLPLDTLEREADIQWLLIYVQQ